MRLLDGAIPVRTLLLFAVEIALSIAAFVAACFVAVADPEGFLLDQNGLIAISLVVLIIVVTLHVTDRADSIVPAKQALLQRLCLALGIAMIANAIVAFIARTRALPPRIMLDGSLLTGVLLFLLRAVAGAMSQGSRREESVRK